METTVSYQINLPQADTTLLKLLAKKFGWTAKKADNKVKKCHLDEAIEDVENKKNLYVFDDVDEALAFLHED